MQYLVSRWGTDPDSPGTFSYDLVGKPADLCETLRAPVDNLFFAGKAASVDHSLLLKNVEGIYQCDMVFHISSNFLSTKRWLRSWFPFKYQGCNLIVIIDFTLMYQTYIWKWIYDFNEFLNSNLRISCSIISMHFFTFSIC